MWQKIKVGVYLTHDDSLLLLTKLRFHFFIFWLDEKYPTVKQCGKEALSFCSNYSLLL